MTRSSVMHGGLSPALQHLDQIRQIERSVDVPDQGLLCDFYFKGWGENDLGVSNNFGADRLSEFLMKLDLDLTCRAHQVCMPNLHFIEH